MNTTTTLPENYTEIFNMDLQKDKKLMLLVNGLGLATIAVMVVIAHYFIPITTFFDMSDGLLTYLLRLAAIIVGIFLYIILHELVHGIFMKRFSGIKPHYGFTLMYAYAGSTAYFNKKHYIIIALAPIVIWGIVLTIINCFVPATWFWVVYFIQIMNISGAAGDMYVTYKFSKMPKDILVHDSGVAMTVYSATK